MLTYTGVGTAEEAAAYLDGFQEKTGADELITVHYAGSVAERVRSVELLAGAVDRPARAPRRRRPQALAEARRISRSSRRRSARG